MSGNSWTDRIFGGFKKTSERLTENLSGIVGKTRLDEGQLDELEDALILSDLGPRAAARIRDKLAATRFERGADEQSIKEAVAEELWAEVSHLLNLPPVRPLQMVAHLWRYGLVDTPLGETYMFTREHMVGVAGDWCRGRLAEHAFESGLMLGRAITEALA